MFAHRLTKSARGIPNPAHGPTESRAVTCSTKTGTVAPFAAAMTMVLTRTRQGVATASPAPSPTVVGLLPCTATHHQFLHHKAVPWLLPRAMQWAMLQKLAVVLALVPRLVTSSILPTCLAWTSTTTHSCFAMMSLQHWPATARRVIYPRRRSSAHHPTTRTGTAQACASRHGLQAISTWHERSTVPAGGWREQGGAPSEPKPRTSAGARLAHCTSPSPTGWIGKHGLQTNRGTPRPGFGCDREGGPLQRMCADGCSPTRCQSTVTERSPSAHACVGDARCP